MFGFLIVVIAGFATPYLDSAVSRPIIRALGSKIKFEDGEVRLLSFLVAMAAAAGLGQIFGSPRPIWFVAAGALGYFATRLVAAAKDALDARRD